jgi:hypothetical protein
VRQETVPDPAKEDAVFGGVDVTGEQVVDDSRARPGDEDPWRSLHQVLRRWQQQIHASEQALASLRLIESTPSLRARLHENRTHWRQQVSDALRRRPGAELDPFTADLLTNAATAALDTFSVNGCAPAAPPTGRCCWTAPSPSYDRHCRPVESNAIAGVTTDQPTSTHHGPQPSAGSAACPHM